MTDQRQESEIIETRSSSDSKLATCSSSNKGKAETHRDLGQISLFVASKESNEP